jgi:hypothetical protein
LANSTCARRTKAKGSGLGAAPADAFILSGYVHAMTNAFGFVLDNASRRWAAAEGVSETVIAAVLLLHQCNADEIAAKLKPDELKHVIRLVGR